MTARTLKKIMGTLAILSLVFSCNKDKEAVDTEYPTIDITSADAFPIQCSVLKRGESFVFSAEFHDNVALGSFSLDIHHNFDHHTHSTEVEECDLGPIKTPDDPFLYIHASDIQGTPKTYKANMEIEVPADIDPGDYHFMIRVTDQEGWQTMKGLSIKIQ